MAVVKSVQMLVSHISLEWVHLTLTRIKLVSSLLLLHGVVRLILRFISFPVPKIAHICCCDRLWMEKARAPERSSMPSKNTVTAANSSMWTEEATPPNQFCMLSWPI